MFNYEEFVSNSHSMLIAPAGYGKTHTIATCLNHTQKSGKQLILTHTHAGVASIKEKIKKSNISSSHYNVETISSFAQKYVLSFYTGKDIPEQENSKEYYPFIIEKASVLFKLKPIRSIISNSYTGLFVDEYQDCTIAQHNLVLVLSELFPTRILGDYMQGIFGFNGESLVDLEDGNAMGEFDKKKSLLDKPQRWLNGNNEQLGTDLKGIRELLISKRKINLSDFKSIELHLVNEEDLFDPKKEFYKKINELLKETNLLIIHPDSTSIYPRLKLVKQFSNRITLIESIDDKEFYNLSKLADSFAKENPNLFIREICIKLFNKTGVDLWFNEKGFKNKTSETDKALLMPIVDIVKLLGDSFPFSLVADILKQINNLPDIKCYRKDLFYSFVQALDEAEIKNISVYQAMTNRRNSIRRIGRKIYGKCIGTTLLTKGLEFDTVAIINAHKFDCRKHLYVALTRASKRLIVFTNVEKLNPYSNT